MRISIETRWMRRPHHLDRARWRRMIAATTLAMACGCVADDSRYLKTAYDAGAQPAPRPASTPALPPSAAQARAPAMASAAAKTPLAPSTAVPASGPPAGSASPPLSTRPSHDVNLQPTASQNFLPDPAPLVIPPPAAVYPIDLATALKLADTSNPTINAARTRILEALALQLAARTLLLPSLNTGVSYHGHNGLLQRSAGKMIDVSLQSLQIGSGVGATIAGTNLIPGVNILSQLTDAWFEPLAARQRVARAQFGAVATSYDILLDVALLHIALLGNQSILEVQRLSETQFHEVYRVTRAYADAGEGRQADANRALSQWNRRRALVQKAEEELAVTAARLANRLNLDTAVRLEPVGGPLVPLHLITLDSEQFDLIQIALRKRPDIMARSAAIAEAEAHHKQEIARPLLPTIWLGFSGGVFGGGSNLTPPLVGNFAGRTDFDVRVYWTLLNFGAGNLSLIRERDAEVGQAVAERSRTINRARSEVSESLAQARAANFEIEVARRQFVAAELAFKQDFDRTIARGARLARDVLPIELLNSLDLLAAARVELVHALVHYDQSQYRLWVALGAPPPLTTPDAPVQPAGT
jgi:outer membrane protein TolC